MQEEIERKIVALLDQHRIMTIATLRPDGWPQATTVGYANEDLTLYFLCGLESQKAKNLARDDRVSLTIDHARRRSWISPGFRWRPVWRP
jgi:nitroimidazol reductase NimA-like FMN-containing flavoprotein (pyridoxamine 5'-phosphate oxidase superfamily)